MARSFSLCLGGENKTASIYTSKESLRTSSLVSSHAWGKHLKAGALPYLHPTDADTQGRRGALLTLLDVPGFLLL